MKYKFSKHSLGDFSLTNEGVEMEGMRIHSFHIAGDTVVICWENDVSSKSKEVTKKFLSSYLDSVYKEAGIDKMSEEEREELAPYLKELDKLTEVL